jgi:arylformamidase
MIYDISPPLTSKLAVWPGDVAFRRLRMSAFQTTAHLGAHVDAPSHTGPGGISIDQCPLEWYLGLCQVMPIDVARGQVITPAMLPTPIQAPRVLFATGTYPDADRFNEDFAGISPELIAHIRQHNVKLIGIDTPSVDRYDAKDLPAHHACLEHGVVILEGLRLDGIPAGLYELIALPLKLVGLDGSPVRAANPVDVLGVSG